MAQSLAFLKCKIGRQQNGHAKYPPFNQLPCVQASGMDWANYVDSNGQGWHYDKKCGHDTEDLTADFQSPHNCQIGVLLVPKVFADEALASSFATEFELEKLNEPQYEKFHNERAHEHEPEEAFDNNTLAGIKAKKDMEIPLTPQQERALNPEDDTPGIVKNKNRVWKDYKKKHGIKVAAI
jgi:hypothetical protein